MPTLLSLVSATTGCQHYLVPTLIGANTSSVPATEASDIVARDLGLDPLEQVAPLLSVADAEVEVLHLCACVRACVRACVMRAMCACRAALRCAALRCVCMHDPFEKKIGRGPSM